MLVSARCVLPARLALCARHAAAQAHAHRAQGRGPRGVRGAEGGAAAGEAGGGAAGGGAVRQAGAIAAVRVQEAFSSAAHRPVKVAGTRSTPLRPLATTATAAVAAAGCAAAGGGGAGGGMEVEVKLRLPDAAAHAALAAALEPSYKQTHQQENFFFDGPNKELTSQRVVLRVRFYDVDKKALITCKGKQVLQDGIGRSPEEEESMDPAAARAFLSDPSALLDLPSPLLQRLKSELSLPGLVCLGGFHNVRQEFEWGGHLLELDETRFDHGTVYELECETTEPERLRGELEALLRQHGVQFGYSAKSKFANFKDKTLE